MEKKPMTDEEIADLAKKIYRGEIFTSYNDGMTTDILPLVFLPLCFLNEEQKKELIYGGIDMIYAPMKSMGPMSANGMPQFFEFNWCNKEDTDKVFEKVESIRSAIEEVMSGSRG